MDEYKKSDTNEQIDYPKMIKVKKADIKNEIEMDVSAFFDLINNDKIDVVFRDKDRFFIVKEGCCFSTNHFGFFNFKEYFEAIDNSEDYSLFIRSNFYYNYDDYNSFIKSEQNYFKKDNENILTLAKLSFFKNGLQIGPHQYKEYKHKYMNFGDIDNETLNYEFREILTKLRQKYIVKTYKEYLKATKLGFQKKLKYDDAMKLGIDNYEEYSLFKKSGFYEFEDYLKANKLGFQKKFEYDEAVELGIDNSEEYSLFKNSEFYEFEDYLKANKLGFQKEDEYDDAMKLGIDNYEEYSLFKKSGFYEFEDYLKANKLGFQKEDEYDEAVELGIDNYAEYKEYQESGCESKEEFEFFKKMPQIIENIHKKLSEIVKDADKAFKSNQFEEFIRLKFLSIEKMAELTHLKVFKWERWKEKDLKVDDIIDRIEEKLHIKFTDYEELKYWRRIRNKIIHEHLKIEKDKAEKGKEFFDELYNNLKKYS